MSMKRFLTSLLFVVSIEGFTPSLPSASFVGSSTKRIATTTTATSSSSSKTTTSLHAKASYDKVFIGGGSSGIGRLVIDSLLASNDKTEIVALVRKEEDAASLNEIDRVTAVIGDAKDQKVVENAMDGCDAAISTIGGKGADGFRIDYVGNNNVIESAGILGVTRIILVTSIGCGSSKEATPPSVYEVLKEALESKTKAENILIKYYTNSDWTIIRPGGLRTEPATGKAVLTQDNTVLGTIHRADVADLVVKTLTSSKTERTILSAVDPSLTEGQEVEAFAP